MTEIELAEKFIAFFGPEYEIYKEVPGYGIIDIVAKSGPITIAVEVKVRLDFRVIEQAKNNMQYCTYSYIAVPASVRKSFGYQICRDYGIGVLSCRESCINEEVIPKINRKRKYYLLHLEEYMKRSVAGSRNDRITAFKATIERMTLYIKQHPGCTLKECLEKIDFHWGNIYSAKGSVYQWIRRGIITEFKLENGKLILI